MFRFPRVSFARFEHLIVLGAYTLIALAMSFPLVAQFGDAIAGVDGDVWSYLWAMGWARAAFLNLGVNPFHTDYVFYPLGGATQLLWGTALPSFFSIPLQLAFGLVPAFNLIYLAASVLTAYGMYLLGKEALRGERGTEGAEPLSLLAPHPTLLPAFLVGLVFAFGALRMGYGIAFTNLFHTQFIPFYLVFLIRATRHPQWKNAILAGFFFACNVYVDFQIAAFLAVVTGLWFVHALISFWRRRGMRNARVEKLSGLGARWLAVVLVGGILSLPMLAFVLQDFDIEGGNYLRVYPLRYSAERSYDALSFFVPNARSAFYRVVGIPRVQGVNASVNVEGESELSPDRQAFLGVTVLVLALVGAVRFRRAMSFWILVTLVFALLSLGPVLFIAGNSTNIPLPFAFVNNVPILNHIRIPMRYGLMVFLGASLLAGAGAQFLFSRQRWLAVPVMALILLEAAMLPYPTLEFRVPRVYQDIAREPGDFAILEIPSFHWRHAAKNEVYQPLHQKRILRAYTNRIAPDVADYFNLRATPIVVKSMRILEGAEPNEVIQDRLVEDRATLHATLNFFNLRYAIVHRDQLDAERVTQIDAYLRETLNARVLYQDEQVTAYQFPPAETMLDALALNLADNSNLMYLGRGWQIEPLADIHGERARWLKNSGEIFFDVYREKNSNARLHIWNDGAPTNLALVLNQQPLGAYALASGWNELDFALPSALLQQGMNHLQLQHSASARSLAVNHFEIE